MRWILASIAAALVVMFASSPSIGAGGVAFAVVIACPDSRAAAFAARGRDRRPPLWGARVSILSTGLSRPAEPLDRAADHTRQGHRLGPRNGPRAVTYPPGAQRQRSTPAPGAHSARRRGQHEPRAPTP